MTNELANAMIAFELATSNLSRHLGRLTHSIHSGADVQTAPHAAANHAACVAALPVMRQVLDNLERELAQLSEVRG